MFNYLKQKLILQKSCKVISKVMWWLIRRCGDSLAALQTTEAVVPGSNPASLTEKNSEDRQSHCVYCKVSGQKGKSPLRPKNERKKIVIVVKNLKNKIKVSIFIYF